VSVLTFVVLALGVVCLVAGAEGLVKGAASIASRFGIAPVIIGLTIVAFGTSAPELAVSVGAAAGGKGDVALGNVLGSNISNILLILGASAAIGGLVVSQRIIRLDVPILISVSTLVLLLSLNNRIGRLEGVLLLAGVITYTVWLIRGARRGDEPDVEAEYDESIEVLEGAIVQRPLYVQVILVLVGLVLLVAGSQLLVGAATDIAEAVGLSDLVIGLTVVAIGTSLPELATSVLAALRGERDIAVGNVVGSNLFNLLLVLGSTAVVSSDGIAVSDAALRLDYPVMLAATFVLLPILWTGFEIRRWEGIVLMAFYATYITYLVLDSGDHAAADVVGPAVLLVTPLVMLTFAVLGFQAWRRHRDRLAQIPPG